MDRHNNTRSSLFLIELIIAILFFSLGSAVCVQAFAKAHTLTAQARDLSFASSTVSAAANVIKSTDGSLAQVQEYFPQAVTDGENTIAVYYDAGFAPCSDADAAYTMRITTDAPGLIRTAGIRMFDRDGEKLYELFLSCPDPKEVSHG